MRRLGTIRTGRSPLFQNDDGFDLEQHGVDGKLGNGNRESAAGSAWPNMSLTAWVSTQSFRHVVVDHEDRELGDLIRPGAERLEGGAQIGVGLPDLDREVGQQGPRAVLAALSGDMGHPGAGGRDRRVAVAVRRRVVEGLRIDDRSGQPRSVSFAVAAAESPWS